MNLGYIVETYKGTFQPIKPSREIYLNLLNMAQISSLSDLTPDNLLVEVWSNLKPFMVNRNPDHFLSEIRANMRHTIVFNTKVC